MEAKACLISINSEIPKRRNVGNGTTALNSLGHSLDSEQISPDFTFHKTDQQFDRVT